MMRLVAVARVATVVKPAVMVVAVVVIVPAAVKEEVVHVKEI